MNESSPVKLDPAPRPAVYSLPSFIPPWLGWLVAAICFLASVFFAAKSFNVRGQLQIALQTEHAARVEAGTAKNLLEAERILSRAQLDRLNRANLDRLVLLPLVPPAGSHSSAHGAVAFNPSLREAVLVASRLPAPPSGKAYHLWATPSDSAPVHLGKVPANSDASEIRLTFTPPEDVRSFVLSPGPAEASAPEAPVLLTP